MFRRHKGAVKVHTLLDLHGNMPTINQHYQRQSARCQYTRRDCAGGRSVLRRDRGYVDFKRLYVFMLSAAFFVVHAKSNVLLDRRYSTPVVLHRSTIR